MLPVLHPWAGVCAVVVNFTGYMGHQHTRVLTGFILHMDCIAFSQVCLHVWCWNFSLGDEIQRQMLTGCCRVCTHGLVTVLLTMHACFVISSSTAVFPAVWPNAICAQV